MQQSLFTQSEQTQEEFAYLEEERKKLRKSREGQRVHYEIPKYKKVYSVYQFNWELYASKFDMLTAIIAGMARHSPRQAERFWGLINPYQEAELENTWQLPIKQRLKLHIQVLRNLQKGLSLEESTKEIKSEKNH